jgi:uncharacterized membrane-anchored protein
MFKLACSTLFCLLFVFANISCAAESPAGAAAAADKFVKSLNFQQGKIALPGNIATLDLPSGFRYLSPEDAGRLLSEGWGNPPGLQTLGMIVPAQVNPLEQEGWGVVVTYEKDGHVKDDEADSIKYDELLKTMQESDKDDNEQRKGKGYPAMFLVGWAEPPHYDKASHKLYWAKELHTDGRDHNGLNYNIRVLGREGVLVLNAVADMRQIDQIRAEMPNITAFTDFTPGNRYADFNAKTDRVAEYGLAALIAGGAAAKLGLFGKLFALILAFKKLIFVGVAVIGAWGAKLLGRKKPVDLSK